MAWEVKRELADKSTLCMRVFYELQLKIRGSVTKEVNVAFSFETKEQRNITFTSLNYLCLSPKQNLNDPKLQYFRVVETVVAQWVIKQYIRPLSTGTCKGHPTMTHAGTVWKSGGLAIQYTIKILYILVRAENKEPSYMWIVNLLSVRPWDMSVGFC